MRIFRELGAVTDFLNYIRSITKQVQTQTGFKFEEYFSLEDFVSQMAFVYLKDILTDNAPRNFAVSYFEDAINPTNEITIAKVARDKLLARHKKDIERLGCSHDPYTPILESKIRYGHAFGYQYNALDMAAVQNSRRNYGLRIISIFKGNNDYTDCMITDPKRCSGEEITKAYRQYEQFLSEQSQETAPEKWLYNLFDVASMEENLCFSLAYSMAEYMETKRLDALPEQVMVLFFCGFLDNAHNMYAQSRLLYHRDGLVPFVCEADSNEVQEYFFKLLWLHATVFTQLKSNDDLPDFVKQFSHEQLVVYFEKHYNLFKRYHFPKLTSESKKSTASFIKRLRIAVSIINGTLDSGKDST